MRKIKSLLLVFIAALAFMVVTPLVDSHHLQASSPNCYEEPVRPHDFENDGDET